MTSLSRKLSELREHLNGVRSLLGMKKKRRRLGSRRDHIGRVRWKLFEILQGEGYSIPSPDCFWMQEGFYRRNQHDLARWGADWRDEDGTFFSIHSWDTMTNCVRYGITSLEDHTTPNRFQICQKEPGAKDKQS